MRRKLLNEDSALDVFAQVAKDVTSKVPGGNRKTSYIGGSIASYAKKLTMSFPVLCDDSLSLETAQSISRANEKNIASMLEMLFTSMSINKDSKEVTGAEIIAQFHKNIDAMSIDDYIDVANQVAKQYTEGAFVESYSAKAQCKRMCVNEAHIRQALNDMQMELRSPKKRFPVSSFSERSLNSYLTKENYGEVYVIPIKEANLRTGKNVDVDKLSNSAESKPDEAARKAGQDVARSHNMSDKERRDYLNDMSVSKRRILDADFKKSNELQPTPIVVNFNVVEKGTVTDRVSFIAGVKCRLIATGGIDIFERLMSVKKTKMTFKDLIRATTGEIKFTKDFLLAIDQQKIDARNNAKDSASARLWNVLKKRSVKNAARKATRDKNDATAITTLIVSQDTANLLASTGNFDILNPKNAQFIMESYNLLCLVIADEANEVAKFLYDGNSEFEAVSYSVLSKEALDREYRKEINLLKQR